MARCQLVFGVPPETIWDVLADAWRYPDWVVGARAIRGWDQDWPRRGSRFHHRVGIGPFGVADHTESIESEPPRRLLLRAKARPFGVARIEIVMEAHPAGTLVTMVEDPDVPLARILVPPPVHAMLRVRNGESLRRLRALAEAGAGAAAP